MRKALLEYRTELARKKHMRLQARLQDVRVELGEVNPGAAIEEEFRELIQSLELNDCGECENCSVYLN